jgi:hypothetical protein
LNFNLAKKVKAGPEEKISNGLDSRQPFFKKLDLFQLSITFYLA